MNSSRRLASHCLLWLAAFWLGACSGGSGPQYGGSSSGSGGEGGGDGNYFFVFVGVDADGRKVEMFLVRDSQSQSGPVGTFDPTTSRLSFSQVGDFSNLNPVDVSGSFDTNGFALKEVLSGQAYTGRFTDTDVVELKKTGTTITYVLTRNQNDAFAPKMSGVWTYASTPSRSLQLRPAAGFTNDDVTLLIEGTEFSAGATTRVSGSASVSRVLLTFHRAAGEERVEGRFLKAGSGWSTQTFRLTDGRDVGRGGAPDSSRALLVTSDGFSQRQLLEADARGVSRLSLSTTGLDVQRFMASPDGSRVAFLAAATRDGPPDLYVTNRATGTTTRLTTYSAAGGQVLDASWSPDGQRIAVIGYETALAPASLYFDARDGGARAFVTSAGARGSLDPSLFRVAWSASGGFVAFSANLEAPGNQVGLYSISSIGANLRTLWSVAFGGLVDFAWAPLGTQIAFRSSNGSELWTTDVAALPPPASYSPSLRGGDVDYYAWSGSGMALAYASSSSPEGVVWKVDIGTNTFTRISTTQWAPNGVVRVVSWSPNSTWIAYLPQNGTGWVVSDGATSQLLSDPGAYSCNSQSPSLGWSADSLKVAYLSETSFSQCSLTVVQLASGSKSTHSQQMAPPTSIQPIRWLPDGLRVVFAGDPEFNYQDDLWVSDLRGTAALKISDLPDGLSFLDSLQAFVVQQAP